MKKIITVSFLLLFLSTPLLAGSISVKELNGDSWVIRTSGNNKTFDVQANVNDFPDSFTAINPSLSEKAWRWTGSGVEYDTTGVNVKPEPSEVIGQFTDYFIDVEGDTNAGLNRVDDLLSTYPTADRAISNDNYGIAKNRIDKANSDGNLSDTETTDLKAILDGHISS